MIRNIVLTALITAVIFAVVLFAQTKEPPQVVTPTAVPSATISPTATPVALAGMDAINQALKEGRCPDPDKIPNFLTIRDPSDLTGQKFCAKTP